MTASPFPHLHVRSWFSFRAGASSPEALAAAAAAHGMEALAVTDRDGVYGAVRFWKACHAHGLRPIVGAEVRIDGAYLVLLAAHAGGYANLCRLLTHAHARDRLCPNATFEELEACAEGLFCLTGTAGSRLWTLLDERRAADARAWVRRLHGVFGDRLSIEAAHHLLPDDAPRLRRLAELSADTHVPLLASGDVRYARPEAYALYDLLTCARLGITVFDAHPERPRNAEAYLKPTALLRRLLPFEAAFARAHEVAEACRLDLLPGYITPPAAHVTPPDTPVGVLQARCRAALPRRYPPHGRVAARAQLEKELEVIAALGLEDYFLVVAEIVDEARRRGIRCTGRGSAANAIVCYLLGITAVDPLAHNLLFERFLHRGRKGAPDIDVDFDTERRQEVIDWITERFGEEQTAMAGTVVTYRARSALREAAKALGWPLDRVDRMTKAIPHYGDPAVHRADLERLVGPSALLDRALEMAGRLRGAPRHLGLHSGGMIIARRPLYRFTPVQASANGVPVVQFDKDDVEALGLVKFDVLGLRMLSAVSEATELARAHLDPDFDVDALPLDDVPTFNMIRAGRTLGTFQIESQGQWHLLASNQPDTFDDLVAQIALFRPGPLQGGMVQPFVRRRRGREAVRYDHPSLEPVLRDTYGIILFQEQVLEVAHAFAGMSLDEADAFRRLMSKFRDPGQMEGMRAAFVGSAVGRGVPEDVAVGVFEQVSKFVGYGFCRSHAAAFARTVYQSCYLKRHYPAAFFAAVMQHRPGMYSLMTLAEEAKRFGVPVLPPDVNRSGVRYALEWHDPPRRRARWAVRKPLTAVSGLSADDARTLVFERALGSFKGTEDLYLRVALSIDVLQNLAQAGALDEVAASSREALWELGVLHRRHGRPGRRPAATLFDLPLLEAADIPPLEDLTAMERLAWDYRTHGAARAHPMTLARRRLNALEVRPIEVCYRLGRRVKAPEPLITVAGLSVLRQRPPTANGILFVTLEDETGLIQCIVYPQLLEAQRDVFRREGLVVQGRLQVEANWRGLVVQRVWPLEGTLGGYAGHPSHASGRDQLVLPDPAHTP